MNRQHGARARIGPLAGWGGVALCLMADPKEIPQQVADLIELAKQYLRQETVEPMKNVGRTVVIALLSAFLLTLGALLLALGVHGYLGDMFPEGQLWSAASAALTSVVFLLTAVLVGRRLRTADE